MIGESSGLTTLINHERIYRENQLQTESKVAEQKKELQSGSFSDVTSFSPEALALAKNVVPVEGNGEEQQVDDQDLGLEVKQNTSARLLDIRV